MSENTEKAAEALSNMSWRELDELASDIVRWAIDDNGEPNCARYLAQCLLGWSDDHVADTEAEG